MRDATLGFLAVLAACTLWGLSPLYYKLLETVPPIELLAHRTLWSVLAFAMLLALQGRLGAVGAAVRRPRDLGVVVVAALMISVNWFLFIFSVQTGRTTEASLGYYIFPLVAVVLGRVLFQERLQAAQVWAVLLAACAVALLSFGLGVTPWISLILAATFGLYGVIKKRARAGSVVSVTAEVLVLSPIACLVLVDTHLSGAGTFGQDLGISALLAFSGVLTAVPLILFSYASQRVRMSTVGLAQYINPTLQFLCAVVIFAEPFSLWHAAAFGLIWTALAIYSASALRQDRARRRAAMVAGTSGAI